MKKFKNTFDLKLPLAGASSIEVIHGNWQSKIYLPEIDANSEVIIGTGMYSRVLMVSIHGAQCAAKEINPQLIENIPLENMKLLEHIFLMNVFMLAK